MPRSTPSPSARRSRTAVLAVAALLIAGCASNQGLSGSPAPDVDSKANPPAAQIDLSKPPAPSMTPMPSSGMNSPMAQPSMNNGMAQPMGSGMNQPAMGQAAASGMLLGTVTKADVMSRAGWADLTAAGYTPAPADVAAIRSGLTGVSVTAFFGAWCSDSERELPKFFKLMDAAGLPGDQLMLVAVDQQKKDPAGMTTALRVTRVPTFIFYRDDREVGRIVEQPMGTLEADTRKIVAAH